MNLDDLTDDEARRIVIEATAIMLGRPLNIYEHDLITGATDPLGYVDQRYDGEVFIPQPFRDALSRTFGRMSSA